MTERLAVSLPERTNLYINNINSQSKNQIEVLIKDGLIACKNDEDFYISIISFNTLYSFYQVMDGYNNQFNVVHQGIRTAYSLPYGNISITTIIIFLILLKTIQILSLLMIRLKINLTSKNKIKIIQ